MSATQEQVDALLRLSRQVLSNDMKTMRLSVGATRQAYRNMLKRVDAIERAKLK